MLHFNTIVNSRMPSLLLKWERRNVVKMSEQSFDANLLQRQLKHLDKSGDSAGITTSERMVSDN